MGLHANVIGEIVNLCRTLWGFYIMEIHAHVMGGLVN